jgi:transmembrane protein EpsG
MNAVLIFGFLATLSAYIAKDRENRIALLGSFILIFLFLAFRYDYGNDYMSYYNIYSDIKKIKNVDFLNYYPFYGNNTLEPGWVILNWLFEPFDYYVFVAFLSLFHVYAYYRFIKYFVPPQYYWLSLLLYFINPVFMLLQLSAMRQGVAIGIFIISLEYLAKRDVLKYIILILIAYLFHNSALILVPLVIIALYNQKFKKPLIFIILFFYLFGVVFGSLFTSQIQYVVNTYFPSYVNYNNPSDVEFGYAFAVLYNLIMISFVLYFISTETSENLVLYKVAIISLLLLPFTVQIIMASRLQMYLQTVILAVIPMLLLRIRSQIIRNIFVAIVIVYTTKNFYAFFHSEIWAAHFLEYKNIFNL